jgi:ABC-2 type transport system permease protein
MAGVMRYVRVWLALARYGLTRELSFRTNFVVKVSVEILWLSILLVFYNAVLTHTGSGTVAGWTRAEYLFFVGCYFTMEGFIETLFLSNCGEFSELIRSGDLDFVLLRPMDEQFMLSLRSIEWTTVPNILMGTGVMGYALAQQGWEFHPGRLALFVLLFACGLGLAYSFLVLLMSSAVWMVRNQSLVELWWLFTMLWRNPREIFERSWAIWIGRALTYVLPVMIITNVPAGALINRAFDPYLTGYLIAATAVMLLVSRRVFRYSLRRYRSASS